MNTPNSMKTLSLRGYEVTYFDTREPKPRKSHQDVIVYDDETIRALTVLGKNVTDCIKERFAKGGFCVTSINKARCTSVGIDMKDAYKEAIEAEDEAAQFEQLAKKYAPGIDVEINENPDGSGEISIELDLDKEQMKGLTDKLKGADPLDEECTDEYGFDPAAEERLKRQNESIENTMKMIGEFRRRSKDCIVNELFNLMQSEEN